MPPILHTKDPFLGPSQSSPLNRAEGNGKATEADRRRFVEIARGAAFECAAIQDVLEICDGHSRTDNDEANQILDRMVAMQTNLGKRGYTVRESALEYSYVDGDSDSNHDFE